MPGVRHPIEGVTYSPGAARWFASGDWIDLTLGEALAATARATPDKPAYIADERTLTFRELDEATDRLAAALLTLGLAPGDRAIFQMGTTPETVLALVGAYKAGVVPVCAVPQYREVEIGQLAALSRPRAYFVQADFSAFDLVGFARRMMREHSAVEHLITARARDVDGLSRIEDLIAAMPLDQARARLAERPLGSEDVLSFQLSGGTTGVPKIIPRFHAEYLGHATGWMTSWGIGPRDRLIWCLPLLHNAGQLYALIPTLLHGVTTVLMPRADVGRMLELIQRHRVTQALSIGPIAPQLIARQDLAAYDLRSLRLFATMNRADVLEAHLGVPCANLFGITEGVLMGSPPEAPAERRHHTNGAPFSPSDQIELRDPETGEAVPLGELGELCFRGPSTLTGYFGAPDASREAFTEDGFFRSGDMMRAHLVDGAVCYAFEGRTRDNVNRGGEKIGCEEVEGVVVRHPAVADAKLVAMPDPIYGEKGCIFLILRPDAGCPSVSELGRFLVEQGLAKFKCPERIEVIEELPVTRVGKLDRPALQRFVREKLEQERNAAPAQSEA